MLRLKWIGRVAAKSPVVYTFQLDLILEIENHTLRSKNQQVADLGLKVQ